MSRKPAHLEMIGGKGPRQRVWEAIRACGGNEWTRVKIAEASGVGVETLDSYMQGLVKAGIVVETGLHVSSEHYGACKGTRLYVLKQDRGVEAPRVTREGKEVTMGRGVENMWQAIRNFLPTFDYREVASYSRTPDVPVSDLTAQSFVQVLMDAGYLEIVRKARKGRGPTSLSRYRLLPHMNTGPRPPLIQRTKTVFDLNLGRVMWQQKPDFDAEARDA